MVVCGGIHMSDIPCFPYALLWEERGVRSVANLTRRDAEEFLALAPRVPVQDRTVGYPLEAPTRRWPTCGRPGGGRGCAGPLAPLGRGRRGREAEAQQRQAEEEGADHGDGEELRPDDVEPGAADRGSPGRS